MNLFFRACTAIRSVYKYEQISPVDVPALQRIVMTFGIPDALKAEKNKRFDGRIADDMIEILRQDMT